MSKFKDFGAGSGTLAKDPISFKLYDEDFNCVTAMPGRVLLDIVARSSSENTADQAAVINDFFSHVLLEESLERFNALVVDKERIVTAETLGEITGWLVEQYSDRPNQQPEV
jgi:hypothetical protein|tara:strand:- start:2237 stop:2572 length:336 start_codon:yes stop_codon:yes gene_type:complete